MLALVALLVVAGAADGRRTAPVGGGANALAFVAPVVKYPPVDVPAVPAPARIASPIVPPSTVPIVQSPRQRRAGGVSVGLFANAKNLRPLLGRVDQRVRCALLVWQFVDNILRSLQIAAQAKEINRAKHLLAAAGADIYALEAAQETLAQANISDGEGADEAIRLQHQGIRELEADIESRVGEAADFALELNSETFRAMEAWDEGAEAALRITDDEVRFDGSQATAMGEYVDLSGDRLLAAADADVSQEIGLEAAGQNPGIRLLGLVFALTHGRIFQAVMTRLQRPRTLEDFVNGTRSNSIAGFVNGLLLKYRIPPRVATVRTALYGMTVLRGDPVYFQIAWGFRVAALAAKKRSKSITNRVTRVADIVIRSVPAVEARMRAGAVVRLLHLSMVAHGLAPIDHLKAATSFLTVALICNSYATGDLASVVARQAARVLRLDKLGEDEDLDSVEALAVEQLAAVGVEDAAAGTMGAEEAMGPVTGVDLSEVPTGLEVLELAGMAPGLDLADAAPGAELTGAFE